MMSEAEAIGWEYTVDDIEREDRERSGCLTDFELMLEYHGLEFGEWRNESGNSRRNLWWNYRKFGRKGNDEK